MPGVYTNGLPLVQPGTLAGVAISPVPAQHLNGREQVPADTELSAGGVPQSVAARTFQVAALAAGMIGNRTTLVSNAGTLATTSGMITTESLTTAAGLTQAVTITNSLVATTTNMMIDVHNGTNQAGIAQVVSVTPAAGSFVATIQNTGTAAFNGTLQMPFKL